MMLKRLWAACAALILLTAAAQAADLTFPPLSGRVVDAAGVLSPDTRDSVGLMLADYEQKSGTQVVVATLQSLQGTDIADYGYQLGRAWGIGQKGKNNGALLIVVPREHQVRIEVGYGLEGQLTDAVSRTIIETAILPAFRRGDFDAGVRAGVRAIIGTLSGEAPAVPEPQPQPRHQQGGFPVDLILLIVFFVFVGGRGLFWPLLFMSRGPWGGGGYGGGYGGGGFSGGGGGFSGGGGSFGGGGASGSW